MVDSISSSVGAPLVEQPGTSIVETHPKPSVQVTASNASRNSNDLAHHQNQHRLPRQLDDIFQEVNAAMEAWATGMRFEIDEDTQQLVVSIIDNKSGEVIRQIPSDEVLHIAKMISQFQGQLISVKA
ncbi:flagellar protein FlaG [bacterium SGD-2]|nr:flagellar protein FlaG [bacterium SGD-2]